jgi:DNA repair exonuclease SbcCD ATPase subunit
MRKTVLVLCIVGALTGCVSKKRYDQLVLDQQRANEQKDSLVADVLAATQMVTDINADLAKVKGLGVSPVSTSDRPLTGKAEERTILLGKIREVIAKLDAAEKQLGEQRKRVGTLTTQRKALEEQLSSLQKTIDDLRTTAQQQEMLISQQKEQIQTLATRVDTLTHVIDESNVVYYAVGTKDELIKRGILVNEGSKFLFFGGKTLMPARDLKPELFQRLDKRRDTVLTVPEPSKEYRIVTRQSPQFLASSTISNGKLKGDVHVADLAFWDGGKYLILVRE